MGLVLRFAARSEIGLIREGNEDSGYAGPHLLLVADGMGGHVAGEVASSIAVSTLAELEEATSDDDVVSQLADAVERANEQLRLLVAGDPTLRGMGTTLTALFYASGRVGLAHVGDSRCYLLRGGRLQQITHDHTFVQSLIDEGRITPGQAEIHPQRSLLTRALDGREDVEPDLSLREARAGDRFLLCSDGLSGVVRTETLETTLLEVADRDSACQVLIDLALRAGGPDNITCIVADVVEQDAADSADEDVHFVGAAAREGVHPAVAAAPGVEQDAAAPAPEEDEAPPSPRTPTSAGSGTGRPEPSRRRRRALVIAVLLVVILAILGSGYAAYAFTQRQYYVAADDNGTVGIYRGVPSHVLGVSLSSLAETQDLRLTALPTFVQERVRENIEASDVDDARRIVANLREVAKECAPQAATATASPRPTASPLTPNPPPSPTAIAAPQPSASVTGPPATGPAAPTASASPTPTPTPTRAPGCEGVRP